MRREVKEFYLGVVDEVNTELVGLGETNKKVLHLEEEVDKVKKFCLALNDKLKNSSIGLKDVSTLPPTIQKPTTHTNTSNPPATLALSTPEQPKRAKGRPPGSGNKNKLLHSSNVANQ